jgi:hypothetical protein
LSHERYVPALPGDCTIQHMCSARIPFLRPSSLLSLMFGGQPFGWPVQFVDVTAVDDVLLILGKVLLQSQSMVTGIPYFIRVGSTSFLCTLLGWPVMPYCWCYSVTVFPGAQVNACGFGISSGASGAALAWVLLPLPWLSPSLLV